MVAAQKTQWGTNLGPSGHKSYNLHVPLIHPDRPRARARLSQRKGCFFLKITSRDTRQFIPPLNKPWCLHVCSTSLLKTLWENEKLLVTSNFSFSHSVLYSFGEFAVIFYQILYCRLQILSVWKSLEFIVWKRVKSHIKMDFKILMSEMFS